MHPQSPARALVCAVALVVVASCTGGSEDPPTSGPTPLRADVSATSPGPGSSEPAPSASATSGPAPSPSPTAVVAPSGTGTAVVDGAEAPMSVAVEGDCMVSGPALPADLLGDVRVDDVEVLLGVDNYLGASGTPDGERPLAVVVDGEADDATVELSGGPVRGWQWWQGPVGTLELSDPVTVDGVGRVTARLTASLERAPRTRLGRRAPQPSPAPAPSTPGPSTPAPSAPGQAATGPASPTPTAATDGIVRALPVGLSGPTGPSRTAVAVAQQGVQALDLSLDLVCTAVP